MAKLALQAFPVISSAQGIPNPAKSLYQLLPKNRDALKAIEACCISLQSAVTYEQIRYLSKQCIEVLMQIYGEPQQLELVTVLFKVRFALEGYGLDLSALHWRLGLKRALTPGDIN